MAIAFHFFFQYWHFMKIITPPIFPLYSHQQKSDLKHYERGVSLHIGAAFVTQPGPPEFKTEDQSAEPCHVFMTFLIVLPTRGLHIETVTYCTSFTSNRMCQIAYKYTGLISLSKFNLPLIGTCTWPTPPGPYRATTCRGRELNNGSHTYFFDHTRTWRASPDEWSALRGATSETAQTWKTIQIKHTLSHPNKANMEWWRRSNDIRGPWGPKVSWQLSYKWGKTPKKTSSRKPVPTGDRTRARCVTSAHATTCFTAVD